MPAAVFVRLVTGALPSGAHMPLLLFLVTRQVLVGLGTIGPVVATAVRGHL